jgi:phage terminase Nu1 subunit (DNA packaging protein)
MAGIGRNVNREQLAELCGVSVRTVDAWIAAGMPYEAKPERRGESWRIDISRVIEWRLDRERKSALGEVAQLDEHEARRRKLAAEAALVEHELAIKRGAAVAIEDSAKAWAVMVAAARARLLGIGNKLGPMVAVERDALECQSIIDGAIHEALQELSGFELPDAPDGDSKPQGRGTKDRKVVGSSAAPKRKRVGRRAPKAKSRSKR